MNYKKAINILNLNSHYTQKQLRHNYIELALKYHPDKNNVNTNQIFQEVNEAYNFLKEINNNEKKENNISYTDLVNDFLSIISNKNIDNKKFLSLMNLKYNEITIEIIKKFPKNTLLQFKEVLNKYNNILNFNENFINTINIIVNEYTKNDKIIKIMPTLDNLLNSDLHKININNEDYYIPYWHHELLYEISNYLLIVQCEPKLPEYIYIDENNNMYININTKITDIFNKNTIDINIGNLNYSIPVDKLYIKRYQQYKISDNGIPKINTEKIFDITNKSSIFIDLYLDM